MSSIYTQSESRKYVTIWDWRLMLCSTVPRSPPYQNVMLGFVISLGGGEEGGLRMLTNISCDAKHHFAAVLKSVTMVFLEIFWSLFHETGLYLTHDSCSLHPNSTHLGLGLGPHCWKLYRMGVWEYGVNETWWIPKMAWYLVHFSTHVQQWSLMHQSTVDFETL